MEIPFGPVERLLDALPLAIARLAVGGRLPRTAPPSVIADELLHRTRLAYANPAFAERHDRPPDELAGWALSKLAVVRVLDRPSAAVEFVHAGFSFGFRGTTLIGILDADLLTGLWVVVADAATEAGPTDEAAGATEDPEIIGTSEPIRRVLEKIGQVAGTDTTVLITGETGTGKELIARAIHRRSARALRPLVAVNCGAISPTLVESELFGHEKGAFTGAVARKPGRFELADRGTLFLDEVGDLPLDVQVKLLRVLQDGEFTRVGGNQTIKVDVRLVAATHRDLPALTREGAFRQDLYYRLNVFPIRTPPLRERRDDIPLLIRHFVSLYAGRLGKRIDTLPPPVVETLQAYRWPGNIRELANLIERSVVVTPGPTLQLGDWVTGQYNPVHPPPGLSGSRTLEDMERDYIVETLRRVNWRVSGAGGAAELLNLKPTTLEARMKKLGIIRPA